MCDVALTYDRKELASITKIKIFGVAMVMGLRYERKPFF
jgi:hypothetical protein